MTRLATSLVLASLALAGAAAPVALQAQNSGPYFSAELAAPSDEDRVIAGGVVFACTDNTCVGPRSNDRPLRVCTQLRREVGTITSFTVNGEAMDPAMLGRCNG